MIVPMKKVILLAVAEEKEKALSALRELGVMQIDAAEVPSPGSGTLRERLQSARRAELELDRTASEAEKSPASPAAPAAELPSGGEETVAILHQLTARRSARSAELEAVEKRLHQLAAWGDFDRQLLARLNDSGMTILLCAGTPQDLAKVQAREHLAVVPLSFTDGVCRFAVAGIGEFDPQDLPVVTLDKEDDPKALAQKKRDCLRELEEISATLRACLVCRESVKNYISELEQELEFSLAGDALSAHGEVVSLGGFVPAPSAEALLAAARKNGWGILTRDPGPDEEVPVLLRENRFTKIIRPLFDFLGVVPGYRELDVSGAVLIFFTIFYAMILGDAGYGTILLVLSLLGYWKFHGRPAAKLPLKLMLVLSSATIIWGALNGSWFGMENIPGTDRPFPGLACLTTPNEEVRAANIQFFCFLLAVFQLSLGHVWRALRDRNWRSIGGNLGWTLIIWGNFLLTLRVIVSPGEFPEAMFWFYGAGMLLVMVCAVNWKDPADIFQFPFSIIGSFTDVLSYIRLFAVGMSGACIAATFNGMALDICRISYWAIPAGVIILLLGHLLNVTLGFMSVLVHGVRLNTLEFSSHSGLTWCGEKFHPFSDHHNQP